MNDQDVKEVKAKRGLDPAPHDEHTQRTVRTSWTPATGTTTPVRR